MMDNNGITDWGSGLLDQNIRAERWIKIVYQDEDEVPRDSLWRCCGTAARPS